MITDFQGRPTVSIRSAIQHIVTSIQPLDLQEAEHLLFTQKWIESGADIFRIAKPDIPDTHLVSYFLLLDQGQNQLLLTDHKKSGLWLPSGGHVEPNEHPNDTVERELLEELGTQAGFLSHEPVFLTVTKTVGKTAGHTDVSLWYVLKGNASETLKYDEEEFHQIQWFSPFDIPYSRTDPHMERFVRKLSILKLLGCIYC
ncbi:MAG: NUDIX hydrolase [Verrucomicrobia bacterium]|nr:NUDIX hydrolase [Verrucomicrobiota bacterium]